MGYFDKVIPKFILNKISIFLTLEKYSHVILAELNFCGPNEIKTLDFIKHEVYCSEIKKSATTKVLPPIKINSSFPQLPFAVLNASAAFLQSKASNP